MKIYQLILICTILVFNINTTLADNCRAPGTAGEEFNRATSVFSGIVYSKEYKRITDPLDKDFGNEVLVVRIQPNAMWKSESADTPVVLFTGNIRLLNGKLKTDRRDFEFLLNESYLVYASGSERKLKTSICNRTKKLSEAADEVKQLYKIAQEERIRSNELFLKHLNESKDLVAEFNPAEIADSRKNELRKLRNSKFDLKIPDLSEEKKKQLQLNDNSFQFFSSFSKAKPAIPTTLSNLVVVGKIVERKAFLSNDKSNIYSEFTFEIKKILKQDTVTYLRMNSEITLLRSGGSVRLPSGKLLHRMNRGYNMPELDKSYVMFLTEDISTNSFEIIAGYKFESGKVVPLDKNIEVTYKGFKDRNFIKIVKEQISNTK